MPPRRVPGNPLPLEKVIQQQIARQLRAIRQGETAAQRLEYAQYARTYPYQTFVEFFGEVLANRYYPRNRRGLPNEPQLPQAVPLGPATAQQINQPQPVAPLGPPIGGGAGGGGGHIQVTQGLIARIEAGGDVTPAELAAYNAYVGGGGGGGGGDDDYYPMAQEQGGGYDEAFQPQPPPNNGVNLDNLPPQLTEGLNDYFEFVSIHNGSWTNEVRAATLQAAENVIAGLLQPAENDEDILVSASALLFASGLAGISNDQLVHPSDAALQRVRQLEIFTKRDNRFGNQSKKPFLERLRDFRKEYMDQIWKENHAKYPVGHPKRYKLKKDIHIARKYLPSDHMGRQLALYGLQDKMKRLRNVQNVENIPVRVSNQVLRVVGNATLEALSKHLARLARNTYLTDINIFYNTTINNADLVSGTIDIPVIPLTNNDESYMYQVVIPAIRINPAGAHSGMKELERQILEAIDDALQSGEGLDWEKMENEGFSVSWTNMLAPRVGTWSPKFEIESYFVKSTIRYIPPEVYEDNLLCIPIAILTSACREYDEQGDWMELEFEQVELNGDEYTIFDTRQLSNVKYYDSKILQLRKMALALLDEVGVSVADLDINSCHAIAYFLGVQIHVLFQEAMCKRMFIFGEKSTDRHITILVRDEHAFPVLKPWRLTGNGSPSLWCDVCHECVSKTWTKPKVCKHRQDCDGRHIHFEKEQKKHGDEYSPQRYRVLWDWTEKSPKTAPFCFHCNEFCITRDAIHKKSGEQAEIGMSKLESCSAQGHRIMDNVEVGECKTCKELLPIGWPDVADKPTETFEILNRHRCYIPKPTLRINEPNQYYVWDIETIPVNNVHLPIYIYARSLYDETKHWEFMGINSFCSFLMQEQFRKSTWIAHNSGGFDSNFVHAWLEDRGVEHTRIPSPMSIHRSLETIVTEFEIRFIDSFSFIPMGLAKIGPAFQLPVAKGDFPHRFSCFEHIPYAGPMPPCDTTDDWYDLKGKRASSIEKSEVSIQKFKQWHAEESLKYVPHTDVPWNYMEQLKSYCKLDCDVLAGALRCLRDAFIEVDSTQISGVGLTRFCLCPIDPLAYLTMAQVCQHLYIAGMYESGSGLRIAHIPLPDRFQSPCKTKWLIDEQQKYRISIWKACSNLKEWIASDGHPVDGYAIIGGEKHVWEYYDCIEKGCATCTVGCQLNAKFGCSNREVHQKIMQRIQLLTKNKYKVHVRWSHEDAGIGKVHEKFNSMISLRQQNDGGFFGGRVEVFKPMWNAKEDEKIQYIDVVSLYPWVCATQRMCTGHPIIYYGDEVEMEKVMDENGYFGYAHVRVRGNKDDYFGGLPRRDKETGRLIFDNSEYTVVCFIDELREKVANGLEILHVYEVWDWSAEGENVHGPMAGYVAYFLRDKMECSGWKALCGKIPETDEEKEEICNHLESENLGLCRPRPALVKDNPGGRQLAKLRLNMLWGKFVQTPQIKTSKFISNYQEYCELWFDNRIDKSTLAFRRVHSQLDFMEVRYGYTSAAQAPSNTHYYLGGSCTAQARLKLMGMLRKVGKERALYCDTDSVVYVQREGDDALELGEALGQWSSEMDEGVWGVQFMALAPKCYMLVYNHEGKVKEKESAILKTKGVTLTSENLRIMNIKNMEKVILTEVFGDYSGDDMGTFKLQANTFNIRMDHAGDRSMMNVEGEKIVQCVYTKRNVHVPDGTTPFDVHFIDTLPF